MSHIEKSIEELENQILQKQKEIEGLQIAVNHLCKLLNPNASPRYEIKGRNTAITSIRLKGDEYFRKPRATAITLVLQARRAKNMGPATIEEICEKMKEGGYEFNAKDPKISIGTALGKNSKFTRIGEGDKWGLAEWYSAGDEAPKKRGRPRKKPPSQENNQEKSEANVQQRGRPKKSEQLENEQEKQKE